MWLLLLQNLDVFKQAVDKSPTLLQVDVERLAKVKHAHAQKSTCFEMGREPKLACRILGALPWSPWVAAVVLWACAPFISRGHPKLSSLRETPASKWATIPTVKTTTIILLVYSPSYDSATSPRGQVQLQCTWCWWFKLRAPWCRSIIQTIVLER